MAFENSGGRCFFIPERCGACMNVILWDLKHFLPSSSRYEAIVIKPLFQERLRFVTGILNTIYWLQTRGKTGHSHYDCNVARRAAKPTKIRPINEFPTFASFFLVRMY